MPTFMTAVLCDFLGHFRKVEQHEKEIGNLYDELDMTRDKEIKDLERKQNEREDYLKSEFRKVSCFWMSNIYNKQFWLKMFI